VQDIRLEGMVHGRVVRPSAPRARLISFDEAAVKAMPGVLSVVRDGSFLAVAARREEQVIAAARALQASARWEEPGDLPPPAPALYAWMKTRPAQDSVVSEIKPPAVPAARARTLQADYTRPWTAHASIGPSCALAQWKDGKLSVWCHSQGVFPLRGDLARALNVPPASITVMHAEGSGCYGQNGADDVALDAALLARAMPGTPVRLQWMREDEFGWEPLSSPMAIRLQASLDEGGRIVDWNHELWSYTHSTRPGDRDGCNLLASWHLEKPQPAGPSRNIPQPSGGSDRNAVPLYEFAQQKITNHLLTDQPIRTSALRTLGAYANVFAAESFMDEMAAAAKADPLQFRLQHMKDPRARAVLERVGAMAQWQAGAPAAAAQGPARGRGVAFAKYKNMAVYCAVVVDVLVDRASGVIRVERAWSAVDAGLVINPDGLRNQIEGGIVQATSWTLHEAMGNSATRTSVRNWNDYPILRFAEVPQVQVDLINRPEERPLGVGEGSHGPTVAAIANAVAQATGRRLRDLPLTPQRVLAVSA
jgi:CO/xanthine dehydrogenase Mo-binding subunit